MKFILIISLILSVVNDMFSQNPFVHEKRDHVWMFGFGDYPEDPEWGGVKIDFNYNPPLIAEEPMALEFWDYNSSMCDPDGNLLFYNDFQFIANATHDTIINGSDLNPIGRGNNWLTFQGSIILPHPGNEDLYYLIHKDLEHFPEGIDGIYDVSTGLYSTLIDMSMGGEVLEKNTLIVADTLERGKISAVRHANGRDWWILTRKFSSTKYFRVLLDAEGLHVLEAQDIGSSPIRSGAGTAEFSPDGTKYGVMNAVTFGPPEGQWIFYFDFDRCSGLLSNYRGHQFFAEIWHAMSIAFSANSRFLYVNDTRKVWQFDTWEEDFFSTADTIGWVDINDECYNEQMKLAPDGKIYITCRPNLARMNVIHNPDEPGLDANYEQSGLMLPTRGSNVPNTANYKLGPIDGSPCDTLGIDNLIVSLEEVSNNENQVNYSIFPNPASNIVTLNCKYPVGIKSVLTIIDAIGQEVIQIPLESGEHLHKIDLYDFENGVYFYSIVENKIVVGNGKLIIRK